MSRLSSEVSARSTGTPVPPPASSGGRYSNSVIMALARSHTSKSPLSVQVAKEVEDVVSIKLYSKDDKLATLRIFDYMGRTISTSSVHLYEGDNVVKFEMFGNEYPRGLYNFVFNFGDNFSVVKVIKE